MSIADCRNREGSRASGGGMHLAVNQGMPADETTDSRHRGGPSPFAPPHTPTPKPSTTSRIGRGGGRGHWSAGAGGLVARRRTDDGGRTMGRPDTEGGRLNTRLWTERRQKGRTERGDGQDVLKNKAPGRISEEKKRKEPTFISDGKH